MYQKMNIPGRLNVRIVLIFMLAVCPLIEAGAAVIINVRELGAKGDGVADDTEYFQKALDTVEESGGVVFVPAGDYRITKTLRVAGSHNSTSKPTDSIEIRGESQTASRLLGDGVEYILGAKEIFDDKNQRRSVFGLIVNRLTFKSFQEDWKLWSGGLDASFMLRWSCRQCVFIGLKTGIYSASREAMKDESPDSLAVYIIRIQNNVFYGCYDYAIKLGRIFDLVISNNEIEHGTGGIAVGWPGDGFDAAANTIRIVDNLIEGLGPGEPAIKGSCWIGGRIVGNYFEANRGGDIELTPKENDGWVRGMVIASNSFQPTADQNSEAYGPIWLTKTIDAVITGNFTTSSTLLHPKSGPLGRGVNIFSNILNNPISVGDIKGAKPGNPSDYLGQLSDLSPTNAERLNVSSPIASVGIHSLFGFQYKAVGENPRSMSYGTTPPSGKGVRHEAGDLVLHLNPKVSGQRVALGWICIEEGEPGLWKTMMVDIK